jgi:predicted transcriptional regulator
MKDNHIHIGKLIQKILKEKGISAMWLAEHIPYHKTSMYKIFQKKYIHPQLMESISIILDTDLFAYYSAYVNEKRNDKKQ